jgi:hypothetical protein
MISIRFFAASGASGIAAAAGAGCLSAGVIVDATGLSF